MCNNFPDAQTGTRQMELRTKFRCFDRNNGRSFDLPTTDPHGEPWTLLSREELDQRRAWCMLPEFHDALQGEIRRRASLPNYYNDALGVRVF